MARCWGNFEGVEAEQTAVPANGVELYISMMRARGVVTTPGLIKMQLRSKVDRLLAQRQ